MPKKLPKPVSGLIEKKKPPNDPNQYKRDPADIEAERRYASSNIGNTTKPDGQWWNKAGDLLREKQMADLEAQRRYDSSNYTPTRTTIGDALSGRRMPALPNSPANSGGPRVGGSSGGGGGGVAPAVPTLEEQLAAIQNIRGTIDPQLSQYVPNEGKIGLMYGQFDAAINKNRQDLTKSYDESIQNIKNNYGQSNNLLNAAAGQDQATLQQAAQNMGIQNYAGSTVDQNLSEQLARLVGSNTGNQAIDLSWFEKLKNLDDSNLGNWLAVSQRDKAQLIQDSQNKMLELQQMADEQARALAMQDLMTQLAASGGSGGGGGGGGYGGRSYGGGGSSSSKDPYRTLSEAIGETMDQNNVGVSELINSIPDPSMREWAKQQWYLGGGGASAESVPDVIKYLYGQLNTLQSADKINSAIAPINQASRALNWLPGLKGLPILPGVGRVSGPGGDPQNIIDLINALQAYDPTFGTVTSRSVDSKSAQSTRVPSLPLPEVWGNNAPVNNRPSTGGSLKKAALSKLKTKKTTKSSKAIKNLFN